MRIIARTAVISTGTATQTIVQINAAADRTIIPHQVEISFSGIASDAVPLEVQLLRTSTDGTSTPTTLVKSTPDDNRAIGATAGENHTVEPTPGDILRTWFIHPQGGALIYTIPEPKEFETAEAGRLSIRVITPPAAVNCVAMLEVEE